MSNFTAIVNYRIYDSSSMNFKYSMSTNSALFFEKTHLQCRSQDLSVKCLLNATFTSTNPAIISLHFRSQDMGPLLGDLGYHPWQYINLIREGIGNSTQGCRQKCRLYELFQNPTSPYNFEQIMSPSSQQPSLYLSNIIERD